MGYKWMLALHSVELSKLSSASFIKADKLINDCVSVKEIRARCASAASLYEWVLKAKEIHLLMQIDLIKDFERTS
jgi:hypothetical protein